VEGVLAEPPPSTLIRTLSNDGATLQFAGWIDQRHNDLAKTRSEAMRRVRRELREAGFVPPEHVQKVILQRGEADFPQAQENGHARDTSVDRALDAQVGNARRLEDGGDLLRPPPPGSPPT
jgi:small-conductance mechanosensitive channel